ncbi:glycosyltransferase [Escherichia albertii]|uniref:glycosyltransferase n=1 Tax=Escherichia albertii TaxID=208962 RepID=UPI0030C95E06
MKILQIGKFFYPVKGGVETVTYDIAEILNSRDIKCDILCTNNESASTVELYNGYKVYRAGIIGSAFSTQFSLQYIKTLRDIIDEYDILHVHLPNPLANIAIMLADTRDKKIVLHWHSDIIKQKFLLKIYQPLQSWLLKKANAIIGTSKNYIDSSDDLWPFRNKCIPIPIGIDPHRLVAEHQKVQKIKEVYYGKKIVLSLGRHVYYKGFNYLIEAAQYLDDDYIVLIGGNGPLTLGMQDKIKELNLRDKVFLIGSIPDADLGSYFEACDVFCLPSIMKSEAFGIVQIEAMSFGKPIVATKIHGSGTCWVNEDGTSGLNVDIKKPEQIAQAIYDITHEPERYRAYCNSSYERFNLLFHRDVMIDNIIKLYHTL